MHKHILIIWLGDKADVCRSELGVSEANETHTLVPLPDVGASFSERASITPCDQKQACDRSPPGSRRALVTHL